MPQLKWLKFSAGLTACVAIASAQAKDVPIVKKTDKTTAAKPLKIKTKQIVTPVTPVKKTTAPPAKKPNTTPPPVKAANVVDKKIIKKPATPATPTAAVAIAEKTPAANTTSPNPSIPAPPVEATPANLAPAIAPTAAAAVTPAPVSEAIYHINQRFAKVPVEYCPAISNGYGFEVSYPSEAAVTSNSTRPTITKVYGNAYLAGLQENAQIITIDNQVVHTQADFNTIAYQGKARQAVNLLPSMALGVLQNGKPQNFTINKADFCRSNLTAESEHNVLRMDFSTKGTGYSAKADARVFVDIDFLNGLNDTDRLTLAAAAAGEQYRNRLRVKRGKTGLFIGQVFGTIVTLFTGLPVTDITASSGTAYGSKDRGEGALRPTVTYGYYLGVAPTDMRASLEKLASYRDGYQVEGKRYDWPIPDDLSELNNTQDELAQKIATAQTDLMLQPKTPDGKKDSTQDTKTTIITAPTSESNASVGTY